MVLFKALLLASSLCFAARSRAQTAVFICELHYDNVGIDTGEALEICGPSGTDLTGWSVALYNGNGGTQYDTVTLSGTIDDEGNGYGALGFERSGIQNGADDALALLNASSGVMQFLSYEGSMTAEDGAAIGMTSTDIGVSESSSTPVGTSLQLTGTGTTYEDFDWRAGITATFGSINADMCFGDVSYCGSPIPVTPSPVSQTPAPTPTSTGSLCDQTTTTITISDVQGSGTSTPFDDTEVTVRGIVTAVFSGLDGFYIQDDGDNSPATSDGIFIYLSDPTVSVGDEVVIRGTATEYYDQTEIIPTSDPEVCSTGNTLPDPVSVSLPSNEAELEALEGMLVSIQSPVVTDNYNADSYGQITVAAERQWQYTQINTPGTVPDDEVGTTLIIDDGSTEYEPDPDVYIDQASDVRVGQTLEDVEGIMTYSYSEYRVQPTSLGVTLAEATNPRPTSIPTVWGANVRVASFNVLNYFTTLGSRGAETEEQRENQLAKITAGAIALNADVIGIIEVENDYDADTPSIESLVASINANDSGANWDYVIPSVIPLGFDEIAVGLIYDTNAVSLKGGSDVLDYGDNKTRASLAQTFSTTGHRSHCPSFTVVVSHFKSKGSDCDDLDDPDADDGQGECNLTRTAAMNALVEWVEGSDIGVDPDDDILLVGDFNAYAKEDPIQAAISAGFIDMSTFDPSYPYVSSYVYYGESGTLDYILASDSAACQRVGTLVHYQINADEPAGLEYDNCGTNDACTVSLDQYRCSDHDIAVQDFNFFDHE